MRDRKVPLTKLHCVHARAYRQAFGCSPTGIWVPSDSINVRLSVLSPDFSQA